MIHIFILFTWWSIDRQSDYTSETIEIAFDTWDFICLSETAQDNCDCDLELAWREKNWRDSWHMFQSARSPIVPCFGTLNRSSRSVATLSATAKWASTPLCSQSTICVTSDWFFHDQIIKGMHICLLSSPFAYTVLQMVISVQLTICQYQHLKWYSLFECFRCFLAGWWVLKSLLFCREIVWVESVSIVSKQDMFPVKKGVSYSGKHKLSGSDRKKLRKGLERKLPKCTDEQLDEMLPSKGTVSEMGVTVYIFIHL